MAWNEPGNNNRDSKSDPNHSDSSFNANKSNHSNPWGQKPKKEGPPDLDKLFRDLKKQLMNLLKGQNKKSTYFNHQSRQNNSHHNSYHKKTSDLFNLFKGQGSDFFRGFTENKNLILTVVGVLLGIYIISGIYIVEPAERAVITRFGRFVDAKGPGPHWLPRFIDEKQIVNVDRTETTRHGGSMLTEDENIVSVEVAVQYRIDDPRAYLFNVVNPIHSLHQVTESALRQVVGQSTLDDVLTSGRTQIATAIKEQIINALKTYQAGLYVSDVALQFAKAPEEVRAAFDDVIKAREEEVRSVNQAESYANDIIPRAKGAAERMRKEAQAYQSEAKFQAQGDTERFNLILPEYQKSPKVTQARLYLSTMEQVLSKTSKVLMDSEGGNNVIYLPLDRMFANQNEENTDDSSDQPKTRRK